MIRFSGSQRRNVRLSLGFYGHEETFTSPVAALLSVAIPVAILIVRLLSFSSIVGPGVFLSMVRL